MNKTAEKKQKWTRPQLIILGRGRPEENVLVACKVDQLGLSGPEVTGCRQADGSGTCRAQGNS